MVFHCRCFSFDEEEIEYETSTQVQSTWTQTFYTASSNFNPSEAKPSLFSNNLGVFTFSELKAATKNFSLWAKIGEGGFGCVYKGVIKIPRDSTKTLDVAVKRLGETRLQGHKEWVTEVNVLGVVEHPNLVKLLGYCAEDNERLLVYEYMPNKSVKDQLSRNSEAPLSWTMRLKVAQDVARGLTYLHEQMDFQIIFRDLKSSNILLDDQWNAKLSDFGLARLGPEGGLTHVSTDLKGTIVYMSPEYIETGHLTSMNDVWSYGMFLFELITGRRPLERSQLENEYMLDWVKRYIALERFNQIIDRRLAGNYSLKSANKLASIAGLCLSMEPRSRPKMSEVLEMVNQLITEVSSQAPPLNSLVSVVATEPKMASLFSNNLGVFTFYELKKATNNFSLSAKIGKRGFGCVYKGVIKNPRDSTKTLNVAVKRLGKTKLQGHKEWVTEVNVLGVVEHPNLVKLLGYCAEDDEWLLVYEYMPNKSVKDQLSTRSEAPLSWTMRLKVAQDVARGLTYLHEQMDFQIIFRDFKSSNILLDDQWNAKLLDFGLAMLGPEGGLTHVSTALKGTSEYMSPEYIESGHLTSMNDIWSYGVFLFELITGRRPLEVVLTENEYMLDWVKPYIGSKRFNQIIDPRLEGKYSLKSANKLASIAGQCLSMEPRSRPKMSEVLEMVNRLITEVPSQAPPLNNLVSVVAIEPKMVFTHAKKTHQNMKSEGGTGSTACFSCICCKGPSTKN